MSNSNIYSLDPSQSVGSNYSSYLQLAQLEEENNALESELQGGGANAYGASSLGSSYDEDPYAEFGENETNPLSGVDLNNPQSVANALQMIHLQGQQQIDNIRLGAAQSQQNQMNQFFSGILQGDSQQSSLQNSTDAAGC